MPNGESHKSIWNCLSCRRRKVRCDRRSPCTQCSKTGLECAFPVSGRVPTRRDETTGGSASRHEKHADLLARLRRLESIMRDLRVEADGSVNSTSIARSQWPASSHPGKAEDVLAKALGSMIVSGDETVYFPSRFWMQITAEASHYQSPTQNSWLTVGFLLQVADLRQSFEDEEQSPLQTDNAIETLESGWPWTSLAIQHGGFNADDHQPLPSQMPFIWQTYCENVDQAVKILHRGTMEKVLRDCKGRFSVLPTQMQALLFAVSLATIASMSEQDIADNFHDTRPALVKRLSLGVEACLSKADVLNTTDIRLLQALVLYTESTSHESGTRASWCMAGLVARVALMAGLHRDGTNFDSIAPFDTEMRRRLWWHICFLDCRSEEAQTSCTQMSIFSIWQDTQWPANVNDEDLDPAMESLPSSRDGITEASLSIVRCHLWRLAKTYKRKSPYQAGQAVDEEALRSTAIQSPEALITTRQEIDRTFLHHTQQESPRYAFLADVVRYELASAELMFNLREIQPITSELNTTCDNVNRMVVLSLSVLEMTLELETSPATSGWYWALRPLVPWRVISVLLVHLRKRPWGPTCERAWTSVNSYMAFTGTFRANRSKDTLWLPVRKLLRDLTTHRVQEHQRLENNPDIARRLRILGQSGDSIAPSWMGLSYRQSNLDLDELEKRLSLETKASNGEAGTPPCPVDDVAAGAESTGSIPPTAVQDTDLDWQDLLNDDILPDPAGAWHAWDT